MTEVVLQRALLDKNDELAAKLGPATPRRGCR